MPLPRVAEQLVRDERDSSRLLCPLFEPIELVDVTLPPMPTARRVTVIAHELRGFQPVGGMGTATTFLALALARGWVTRSRFCSGSTRSASIDPTGRASTTMPAFGSGPSRAATNPWSRGTSRTRTASRSGCKTDPPDVVDRPRLRRSGVLGAASATGRHRVRGHAVRRLLPRDETLRRGPISERRDRRPADRARRQRARAGGRGARGRRRQPERVPPRLDARAQAGSCPEQTLVIPYFTRSEATGEPAATTARPDPDPLRRLAFFGRVDEKKGLRLFAAALNAARAGAAATDSSSSSSARRPRRGRPSASQSLLSDETKRALRRVRSRPSSTSRRHSRAQAAPARSAVIPSLHDNSPNTVYECLEHGIPFIASNVGGVPELIAPERSRPTSSSSRPPKASTSRAQARARRRTRPCSGATGVRPRASRPTAGPRCSRCGRSDGGARRRRDGDDASTSSSCAARRRRRSCAASRRSKTRRTQTSR